MAVGWGGAERVGGVMVQSFSLAPENRRVSRVSGNHFYSCSLQLCSISRKVQLENALYDDTCTKMYKLMENMCFYGFDGFMVLRSSVSRCSQQWYLLWYKQVSLVMLFVLLLPYHRTRLELTKFSLDHTGCGL